jgi:alpha-1,2-mannosyltransferase
MARLAGCALLYAASCLALVLGPLGHHWPFVDLAVYRDGGRAILDHARLYELRFPGDLAFTYPPLAALVFVAVAKASLGVTEPIVTVGSMILLPVMLRQALRLQPLSSWLSNAQASRAALVVGAAALWLEPMWTTLRYGQIDVLIATLILFDLSRDDESRSKGVAIGLAIGLKLTPGIFAAYLLFTRRYRAAVTSLVVFVLTVAAGFALAPGDSQEFWGGDFLYPKRVGRIENAANQSLRGAWARVLHSLSVETVWLCSAVVVGAVGMVLACRAGRRGEEALGFSLCALTGLLVSPVSWSHHWVLAIPVLLLFVMSAHRAGSTKRLLASLLVAIVGYSQMIWWVPVNRPRHSELHLGSGGLLLADSYVLGGLVALAAGVWLYVRNRPEYR